MMKLIYGDKKDEQAAEEIDDDDEDLLDCIRFDVAAVKLEKYKETAVKRKLKSKFVTGQTSD